MSDFAPRRRAVLGIAMAALALAGCGREPSKPDVGGDFSLVDQNGRRVDQKILKGKWSAVFFGFTYCPDVCPTTLQTLTAAADRLGPKAKDFQVVFVSVDPERDTPAQLKLYLDNAAFPKGTVGLTGTAAEVATVAKAYHVFYQKDGAGPDYLMQHAAQVYLMDPKGRFARILANGLGPDEIASQIAAAMRES